METACYVRLAAKSVIVFILVQSVHQVFLTILILLASAVKDFVLHAQNQMFVRVAVQVDLSL
jgi:Flp pilus assembly protein protease CpaA